MVPSLKVLGQRLAVKLDPEGLPLTLGGDSTLDGAIEQLAKLQTRLEVLSHAGLPPAVRHQLWLYASAGAVNHLLACSYYRPDQLMGLDALQRSHLAWVSQRDVDINTEALASLPASRGGIGLPCYSKSAPAIFLAAQSRLMPATATLLGLASPVQIRQLDTNLSEQIDAARDLLLSRGCRSMHLPFGPAAPTAVRTTRTMVVPQHKLVVEALKTSLAPSAVARFLGQANSAAGTWLHEHFPGGQAQPSATWHTMMRGRLLLTAPGVATLPAPTLCGRSYAAGGSCNRHLCDDGAHEYVCAVGGFPEFRHNRVRDWLAQQVRELWACRVQTEEPVATPLVKSSGRMDVVAHRLGAKVLIDVVVGTTFSDNAAEASRRAREPGRSLRMAASRKLARYGPSVLPFTVEDTGRLGSGAMRLLKELASETEQQEDIGAEYRRLVAELQHIVLGATASMLQAARGQPPTF